MHVLKLLSNVLYYLVNDIEFFSKVLFNTIFKAFCKNTVKAEGFFIYLANLPVCSSSSSTTFGHLHQDASVKKVFFKSINDTLKWISLPKNVLLQKGVFSSHNKTGGSSWNLQIMFEVNMWLWTERGFLSDHKSFLSLWLVYQCI